MRAFIAIDLPEELKKRISQLQENLKKYPLPFRWVKPANIHLTLKFLGNITEDQIPEIEKIISGIISKIPSFEINLDGFGFFPSGKKPRLLFIKGDDCRELKTIVNQLENQLQNLGFPVENRFKPHITLARIKKPQNIDCFKDNLKNLIWKEKFKLKEIVLYKSIPEAQGPTYQRMASSPLAD